MDKIYGYIMRYKLKDTISTPVLFKGLPTYNGYLGVQEKSAWVARLCYLRDGPIPTLSIYDAAAKDPPEETMLVSEIQLVGFVEVGEFKVPDSGRLTLRAKAEPRPNGFTLLVNDKTYSFDAAKPEIRQAWIGALTRANARGGSGGGGEGRGLRETWGRGGGGADVGQERGGGGSGGGDGSRRTDWQRRDAGSFTCAPGPPTPTSLTLFLLLTLPPLRFAFVLYLFSFLGKFYAFIEKYHLNENAPVVQDTKRSITSFVRRKRPEDYAAEAALAKKSSTGSSDGTPELHNLPEDVINPFEDDFAGGVFENSLFGEDD